jgi:hypothetical protein
MIILKIRYECYLKPQKKFEITYTHLENIVHKLTGPYQQPIFLEYTQQLDQCPS